MVIINRQHHFVKLLLLMSISIASPAFAEVRYISPYPIKIGEKIVFTIKVFGIYAGDQVATIDGYRTFQGQKVIVGNATVKSTKTVSKFYNLDDKEVTYFLAKNLNPVYNEKWIVEGKWHDHMVYTFSPTQIQYYNKMDGNRIKKIPFRGSNMKNYYTLVISVRSIDYDYYISKKKKIYIHYLLKEKPYLAILKPKYITVKYNGKKQRAIYLEEIKGGLGFKVTILDNKYRIPLNMTIPTLKTDGKKSIELHAILKSYKPGTIEIVQ